MDFLANLQVGLAVSLSLAGLWYCLLGVMIGTAIGVLPGLGPTATISLLLPITAHLDTTSAIIMLAGIYYGAQYGGSITSILVRIPGEAASVVSCIDGYEMARQGRAGPALGISAFGSFIAGVVATIGVAMTGPAMVKVALAFGPAERTSLMVLGLVLVTSVSSTSQLRSLLMVVTGLLIGMVGVDPISGAPRFAFGVSYLFNGFDIAILAMGLFGIAELLTLAERRPARADHQSLLGRPHRVAELLPSRQDWKASAGPIARGSVLGFALGLLPGGGALLPSFASYVLEKRLSKHPERFGKGAIEGLAGPESANNAGAQAAFVPLLCLGIPANVVMGVIMGALMIQGIPPGPLLVQSRPDLFWGVITSMFVGNLMLVILNVPLISLFITLLRIPQAILAPLIMVFCVIGAYSLNNNPIDVLVMAVAGMIGYAMRKVQLDPAPLLIAFLLGGPLEATARQALLIGFGDPMIFVTRPISAAFLAVAALLLVVPLVRSGLAASTEGARARV